MKKFCLAVLTVFLYGVITAQVAEEKSSSLFISELRNDICADNKGFIFHSPSYEHFNNKTSIDYLQKSKTQKTWAWILTGIGAGIVTVGLLTQDYVDAFSSIAEEKNSASPAVYAVGGSFIAGGIVLFVASSRNKKKAMSGSAILKMENALALQQNSGVIITYPTAGIRISFR